MAECGIQDPHASSGRLDRRRFAIVLGFQNSGDDRAAVYSSLVAAGDFNAKILQIASSKWDVRGRSSDTDVVLDKVLIVVRT